MAQFDGTTIPALPGYHLLDCLHQGSRTAVYRARHTATERPVVVKVLAEEYPSFTKLVQFRNQYTVTKNLPLSGIVRSLDLVPWGNSYALVMEDVGGLSLAHYLQRQSLTLEDVLDIAVQLSDIFHDLHQQRVIHKDIKPANILIHPDSKQVKLIDFSIASLLPKETQALQSPQGLEGTLGYLAPEQTGRMNRGIDYRTDFYGLGVSLYQLLTGQLPFTSQDPLELIHAHMAQMPVAVDQLNPDVPAMVGAIVAKLMAKNAEDRYQSAWGLKHDLERCLFQWKEQGEITEFELGQRDISDRFLIPEKLYGREQEVQTLLDAFERVANGTTELMLVAGFSGIGKTAVVNEVHKPITRQQGYFIKGKFDQFNRDIPLSAFVQAFRDLMSQLLSETEEQLAQWRTQILTAVGENGQVLIDVIPELEQIIGQQPLAPELSGSAAQNRFNLLFQKFIAVLTAPEHPLVMFLDDLQWADSASLNLLKLLLINAEQQYLFIIGAYRDNEVFPAHPLMLTGQLLLQKSSTSDQEERLFEIANHLNVGIALMTTLQEREHLSQLNLAAGRKAKIATAYSSAVSYLSAGIDLLPKTAWESHYSLALALYEEIAEASYLNTDFEQMERWAEMVLQQANTLLDTINVQKTRIMGAKSRGQLSDSINIGLQVLQALGIGFPEQPTQEDIGQAYEETRSLWAHQSPQSLLDLPTLQDPHRLAAMEMLTVLVPAAYMVSPNLMLLLIFKQVEISIQSGNSPVSIFAYGDYGIILCGIMGDVANGYEFGELALSLLEKFQAKSLKGRSWYVVHAYIKHWKTNLADILPRLQAAYYTSLDTGDMEALGWNSFGYCSYSYHAGQNLAEIVETMEAYRQSTIKYKQAFCLPFQEIYQQTALNLLGQATVPYQLSGEIFDQEKSLSKLQETNQRTALFFWFFNQSILYYVFGQNSKAIQVSAQAAQYLDGGIAMFMVPLYFWFDALIQLTQFADVTEEEQQPILLKVQEHQGQLQGWATLAPTNHQHRWELLEAERLRVLNQHYGAGDFYDRAIASAKENGFIQDEALANELAAKFYLDWGKEKIAAVYMQEAYYCYARWGAKAKVADLETRYPELLRPILQSSAPSGDVLTTLVTLAESPPSAHTSTRHNSSSTGINQTLDFASILKASQVLASTIELDELLRQLTQIILQNSGGDRCALILPNATGEWQVRAIATPTEAQLCTEALDNNPALPVKLIQYVKNTQAIVVIDDLVTDLPVIDDYLTQRQPKSVLCLPILNQGQLIGILYLKNHFAQGVFTEERVLVLNFLCTQAAISLENARLYQQVQQSLTDVQQIQLQLVQSEKMSALGGLVAGVAHEINNPVGCILGNVGATQQYINDLLGLLDLYAGQFPEPGPDIEEELEDIDLDYVREDLPKLMRAMKDSGDRIKSISQSLRTFSRADTDTKQTFNLHEGIDSTVLILRHRLKANGQRPDIEVVANYGDIPEIHCFPGQLNQVFMNILANAIDAFDEVSQHRPLEVLKANLQRIIIRTGVEDNWLKITIADNGPGIPAEIQANIFDHLFTTKEVGKGTGLGLAIARQIVEDKHGGSLAVHSEAGQGTEFRIQLPLS
jgi:predicted ATPase/signal transduction histidine kinase